MFFHHYKTFPYRLFFILLVLIFPVKCAIMDEPMITEEMKTGIETQNTGKDSITIIPAPMSLVRSKGTFVLNSKTKIVPHKAAIDEAEYLAEVLAPATGYKLSAKSFTLQIK